MPEVREIYTEVEKLSIPDLHYRREALIATAKDGNLETLSDEALTECLAITRALRKRSAPTARGRKTSAPPADNSDLL